MKTTDKKFKAVDYQREQRDIMSEKLAHMTKEEIVEYFAKRKKETTTKPQA